MGGRARKLGARLAKLAEYVQAGESVADIGADHGYLPLHLVREGRSPFAILTDKNAGPLACARERTARIESGGPRIEFRLGDGLTPLAGGEVDVVVVAGMGGETIIGILAADPVKARTFRRFLLQPRTKTDVLRAWLAENGWTVLDEAGVEERGRMCDVIVCVAQ